MCPEHRSAVLADVKRMLAERQPLVLVSTQLIEAGVDVSFPAVFRAECGLDSLAQAAGRCNRNGELRDANGAAVLGHVYSFEHSGYDIPQQLVDLRDASSDAAQITQRHKDDLLSLEAIEHFFRLHIWTVGQRTKQWDQPDVTGCFPPMAGKDWQLTIQYREAAKRFQMIPQATHPLVIPWGKNGKALCKELRERDRIGLSPHSS
jgi:CRISPR-associated endonuclease/helicase Cas3